MKDFEKSGIHMPERMRNQFVKLNDRILELGQEFVENAHPSVSSVHFENPTSTLNGLPSSIISKTTKNSKAHISTISSQAQLVLKMCTEEESRKKMFIAMNSADPYQMETLEELLKVRGELANLLGKKSYAHVVLADQMAKSPENVVDFLISLANTHKPNAELEIKRIQNAKKLYHGLDSLPIINAWDKNFYTDYPVQQLNREFRFSEPLHVYFSVGSAFYGISSLFKILYGVTLQPAAIQPGETWHDDVRKLEVIHETDGLIGIIYCDIFTRMNHRKFEAPAHFTIRCSRRIDDDFDDPLVNNLEIVSNINSDEKLVPSKKWWKSKQNLKQVLKNPSIEKEVKQNDGKKKKYLLPIVVL
ncbi:Mitochondrial intermediate peptidase, partial [Nowakowskiella sp. JEL0078]